MKYKRITAKSHLTPGRTAVDRLRKKTFFPFFLLMNWPHQRSSKNRIVEQVGEEIPTQETAPITEAVVNQCDNIFYPLALDNQWIYRISIDQISADENPDLALTVSENSGSSAEIAALDYSSGIVTQSAVACQDGEIINFPVTELNMILGMLSGELNLEFTSGRFMPSEKEFEDNNWSMKWETEYIANGNLQGTYEGETLTALLSQSPVKMTWMVVGTGETMQLRRRLRFRNLSSSTG